MILSKRNDKLSCFVTKTFLKHVRVDLKNCIVNNSKKNLQENMLQLTIW